MIQRVPNGRAFAREYVSGEEFSGAVVQACHEHGEESDDSSSMLVSRGGGGRDVRDSDGGRVVSL